MTDQPSILSKFNNKKSDYTPKASLFPTLQRYFEVCNNDIASLKTKPLRKHNLSPDEQVTLCHLKSRTDIVIMGHRPDLPCVPFSHLGISILCSFYHPSQVHLLKYSVEGSKSPINRFWTNLSLGIENAENPDVSNDPNYVIYLLIISLILFCLANLAKQNNTNEMSYSNSYWSIKLKTAGSILSDLLKIPQGFQSLYRSWTSWC